MRVWPRSSKMQRVAAVEKPGTSLSLWRPRGPANTDPTQTRAERATAIALTLYRSHHGLLGPGPVQRVRTRGSGRYTRNRKCYQGVPFDCQGVAGAQKGAYTLSPRFCCYSRRGRGAMHFLLSAVRKLTWIQRSLTLPTMTLLTTLLSFTTGLCSTAGPSKPVPLVMN